MAANAHLQDEPDDELPVTIDRGGRLLPSLQHPGAGLAMAEREASGAVDSWDEYLCAFRGDWGFDVNVYRYEWLGEVPEDWFDEDGEPLPKYQDANGDLKLPEVWDYRPVLGYRYGGFIGELVPAYGTDAVRISDCSDEMVREALQVLRWHDGSIVEVQKALQLLGAAAPSSQAAKSANEPLAVSFFSVVVKHAAVERSYPGGVEEFDRVQQPARSNAELSVLVRMSLDDAHLIFEKLRHAGLVPGEDFGLVDMQQGALVPCHGIKVVERPDEHRMFSQWFVQADQGYRYQPEDVALEWQLPEPKPEPIAQTIEVPPGITAYQYYQWRGIHSPENDE